MARQERDLNRMGGRRKLAAENLKRCPLCDALNAAVNRECFVCGWHGTFVHDPDEIEDGVRDLMLRCPSFQFDYEVSPVREFFGKFWRRLFARRSRRLDLHV